MPKQISDARLREIVQLAGDGEVNREDANDLLSELAEALQPEPECECPGLAGVKYGSEHYEDCPITAYRQHRAARLRIIEEG